MPTFLSDPPQAVYLVLIGAVLVTGVVFARYQDRKRLRPETDVEEIRDLGNGVTLAVSPQTGRPAGSTGEVQIRFASIQVCEDGLIAWMKNYNEIDETRAAAERLAAERG